MTPPEDFAVYVGAVTTGRVEAALWCREHFERAAFALRLFHQAERRGAKGRRARRKLAAWLVGSRSVRGDMCPFVKLSYQRMWARGIEHARAALHTTFRPARVRQVRYRWIPRMLARRRRGSLDFNLRIDVTPAIESLKTLQGFLRAYVHPAKPNPLKECPPPCP